MLDRPAFNRQAGTGGGDQVIRDVSFEDLGRLADRVLGFGVSVVLIKLGDRGAYLRTGPNGFRSPAGLQSGPAWKNRELYSSVFSVPRIAGTAGSGDATIAGFLASLVRDLGPEEALTNAVAVGACCVEAPDATSGVRPWEETMQRVRAGWKRREAAPAKGWKETGSGVLSGPGDRG